MATEWKMDGPYLKSCSCDPGCPCDFNQHPTQGHCEGIAVMKVESGHFGDVDLSGLCWGAAYHWPGALHEGNGDIQPFVDERASEPQRDAILQIVSGQHGGTFFQVLAVVAPNVKEPQFCAIDFECIWGRVRHTCASATSSKARPKHSGGSTRLTRTGSW